MNNFDFLSVKGTAVSVVSFATVIWSRHAMALYPTGNRDVVNKQKRMFKGKILNIKKFQCENECWRWDRVESMYKFTLF